MVAPAGSPTTDVDAIMPHAPRPTPVPAPTPAPAPAPAPAPGRQATATAATTTATAAASATLSASATATATVAAAAEKEKEATPPRPSQEIGFRQLANKTTVEVVRSTWQMASVAHFLETFGHVLPLKDISADTAADLTPEVLEAAVAAPDTGTRARVMLRDVMVALLVGVEAVSAKSAGSQWFQALRVLVERRAAEFDECLNGEDGGNVLAAYESGMEFLTSVRWDVRLGLLLGLCDMAAEECEAVRNAIRECELEATASAATGTGTGSENVTVTVNVNGTGTTGTMGGQEAGGGVQQTGAAAIGALEARGIRLAPLGRCSLRRTHYKVGKTRIYSGYREKGRGDMVVECSDSGSMKQLAAALCGSAAERDQRLGQQIRDEFVAPLEELERRVQRKLERERQAEAEREESRRRNAHRPRRRNARYCYERGL